MRQIVYAFLAILLTGPLAACGFTPLYADGAGGAGLVSIEKIEGRAGQTLRKNLVQQLAAGLPGLNGPADLTIVLDENLRYLALQPDQAATRTDIISEADYVLAMDGRAISGKVRAEATFNVPTGPFANISAQIDASDRAAALLASRIVDDLRLKLAQQK